MPTAARDAPEAHRIDTMILHGQGWSAADIAAALSADPDAVRNCFKRYQNGGVEYLPHSLRRARNLPYKSNTGRGHLSSKWATDIKTKSAEIRIDPASAIGLLEKIEAKHPDALSIRMIYGDARYNRREAVRAYRENTVYQPRRSASRFGNGITDMLEKNPLTTSSLLSDDIISDKASRSALPTRHSHSRLYRALFPQVSVIRIRQEIPKWNPIALRIAAVGII